MAPVMPDDESRRLWYAYKDAEGNLVRTWGMSVRKARKQADKQHRRTEARFRAAPFPLYGLPPSRQGGRFLGGVGRGGKPRHVETWSLSLVHGTLVQGEGPLLSVETSSTSSVGGDWLLSVAQMVWTGRASTVEEAVGELARRHPNPSPDLLAAAPAATGFAFSLDSVPTSFDAFLDGDEWVARAPIGPSFLTVVGNPFDPADVELVRITDLEPYVLGTRHFYARG